MIKLKELIKDQCNCDGDCCSKVNENQMQLGKIFTGNGFAFRKEFDKIPLTEKVDLDQKIIDKIAKLTDYNNHNEARLVLAKEMKLKNLVKGYEAIMVLHDMFRQMNEMMAARTKLDKMLMTGAERKYSNYKDIYYAF